jgi:Kef-type K+ transport system membrane component KefB
MSHSLQLLLLLSVILLAAKLAGAASRRIGQPAVFGELLAGLVLGPTALNILGWGIFSGDVLLAVRDLAEIGVCLLMFIAGLETDLEQMRRVGRVAFWSAAGGVALPMAGGALTAGAFGLPLLWEGIFIGAILTATSVSISAQTLLELGVLRSKEGATILGAAVIDDVMGIIVLSVVVAMAQSGLGSGATVLLLILRMLAFFTLALLAGRLFAPIASWANRLPVSQGFLGVVLAIALVYAWGAEYIGGVAAITGSYIAGVTFATTPHKKEIDAGIHPLTYSFFVPIFFISLGLQANGRDLGPQAPLTIALIVVAILTKVVGCGTLARVCGFSSLESVRVGIGMISRGEVGLIMAGYGLSHGLIGNDIFSASVFMVLITTMLTPPLLRAVFPKSERQALVIIEETIADIPEEIEGSR